MMKRLFLVLGIAALLGTIGLAQSQVNYNVTFPRYALVVTDMTAVNWDFSTTTNPSGGKAQYVSGVYEAWTGGLADCLADKIASTGSVVVQDTAGSTSISTTCYFAPTSVVLGGPVTVDWATNYGTIAPDGTLVVITNATNFQVDAAITTSWSNLTGATLYVLNDATSDGTSWLSGATPSTTSFTALGTTATTLVDTSASTGLYKPTNYTNVYAVPTIWAVKFDPTAQPDIATPDTAVVTFTGTALP